MAQNEEVMENPNKPSTDRELIRLAAKAFGMTEYVGIEGGCEWDPLGNFGDAVALAAELRMHIGIEDRAASAWAPSSKYGRAWATEPISEDRLDAELALCRAITSCAARIGRAMP